MNFSEEQINETKNKNIMTHAKTIATVILFLHSVTPFPKKMGQIMLSLSLSHLYSRRYSVGLPLRLLIKYRVNRG